MIPQSEPKRPRIPVRGSIHHENASKTRKPIWTGSELSFFQKCGSAWSPKTSWQIEKSREILTAFQFGAQLQARATCTVHVDTDLLVQCRRLCSVDMCTRSEARWYHDRDYTVRKLVTPVSFSWIGAAALRALHVGPWSAQTAQHWHPTQSVQVCQERRSNISLSCEVFFVADPVVIQRETIHRDSRVDLRYGFEDCREERTNAMHSESGLDRISRASVSTRLSFGYSDRMVVLMHPRSMNRRGEISFVQWVRHRKVVSFHSNNETDLLWLSRQTTVSCLKIAFCMMKLEITASGFRSSSAFCSE